MVDGFMGVGSPERVIGEVARQRKKALSIHIGKDAPPTVPTNTGPIRIIWPKPGTLAIPEIGDTAKPFAQDYKASH